MNKEQKAQFFAMRPNLTTVKMDGKKLTLANFSPKEREKVMANGKTNTSERLAVIETEIRHVKDFMLDLKDNHLASIYTRLTNFETKMMNRLPAWGTIIITFLSSLCVGLIVWGSMR